MPLSPASSTGGAAGNYTVIADATIAGSDNATLCDFTSIPQTYAHLYLVCNARTDRASNTSDFLRLRFNNDATAIYYAQITQHTAGAVTPVFNGATAGFQAGVCAGNTADANVFLGNSCWIPDYASTTRVKDCHTYGGGAVSTTVGWLYQTAGYWNSTAAISRITVISTTASNFKVGSRATLYGMSV